MFFEEVIRENLDLGRPDRVQLIFDRRIQRRTRTRNRTRVVTDGVAPSLLVDYKHSHIRSRRAASGAYYKHGRALRTETVVNDVPSEGRASTFGIGRRLNNLDDLKAIGFAANRRLLGVQRISHHCQLGLETFDDLHRPAVVDDRRASALRFGNPRVQALLATLLAFRLLPEGFANREFREHVGAAARTRCRRLRAGPRDLRPGPAASARSDREDPAHAPLPGHRARPPRRPVLLPHAPPRPRPDARRHRRRPCAARARPPRAALRPQHRTPAGGPQNGRLRNFAQMCRWELLKNASGATPHQGPPKQVGQKTLFNCTDEPRPKKTRRVAGATRIEADRKASASCKQLDAGAFSHRRQKIWLSCKDGCVSRTLAPTASFTRWHNNAAATDRFRAISHARESRCPTPRRGDVHFRLRKPTASVHRNRKPDGPPRCHNAPGGPAMTPRGSSSSHCRSSSSTCSRASSPRSGRYSTSRPSPTSPASGSTMAQGAAPTRSGVSDTATAPVARWCSSWSSSRPWTPTWPGACCATWAWRPSGCVAATRSTPTVACVPCAS